MAQRVQREAAQPPGGVVSERARRRRMAELVERDANHERKDPRAEEREEDEEIDLKERAVPEDQ